MEAMNASALGVSDTRQTALLCELAERASGLVRVAADVARVIEEISALSRAQAATFELLRFPMLPMGEANGQIHQSAIEAEALASGARAALGGALRGARALRQAVNRVEYAVDTITAAPRGALDAAKDMVDIALRSRWFHNDAVRNRKGLLMQTHRRDVGGAKYILTKDLSAPGTLSARHRGAPRLAHRFD